MKLHEKAKQLGIKTSELTKHLQSKGHDIKSPNQTLSEQHLIDADLSSTQQEVVIKDTMFSVAVTSDNKAKLFKIAETSNGVEVLEVVKEEAFPNKHQAFMRLNYWLQKIELGSIK